MKDLLYTDVEESLRDSTRALLGKFWPSTEMAARVEAVDPDDSDLWTALACDLGVAGLAVADSSGGQGGTWREMSVVAEELGRSLAPTPFLGSTVLATATVQSLGCVELLGELASGTRTAALVCSIDRPHGAWPTDLAVRDGRIVGRVRNVVDVASADYLLVPVTDSQGRCALYSVPRTSASVTAVVSLDLTRPVADVTFDVDLSEARLLADGRAAREAVDAGLIAGTVMLSSELLGVAERCMELTIDYLAERRQFGVPIGSFQALKHRVADQWALMTQARAVARYAAACLADDDPDTAVAASVAKAYISAVAVRVAEECVQLHGGIGFTWEAPLHLYLKRAKANSLALGSPRVHYTRLADLVGLAVA